MARGKEVLAWGAVAGLRAAMVDCTYLVRVLKLRNLRQLPRARLLGWLRGSRLRLGFRHAAARGGQLAD